jgi:predicted O-methyltransferase YrrM
MRTVKNTIKSVLSFIPPFDQFLDRISTLRKENGILQQHLEQSQQALQAARQELETVTKALWVAPGHFYSPIPDLQELEMSADEIFEIPPAIRGVELNESRQLEILTEFRRFYAEQPFSASKVPNRRYFFENPNYSYADAIVLYCMMRFLRPQRIIEVGSGYSSCAILDVNELFFDNSIACTFIEPYPQLLRSVIKKSDLRSIRLIGQKVQDVDVNVFRELQASDILFIDSSHVSKTGSDVNYILFKILPLLNKGVYIHIHDIFYPFEYPRSWVNEGRAWNETYLLRAFLQYNQSFQMRFFTTYLIRQHPELFKQDLPLCLKNTGGSFWIEKTGEDAALDRMDVRSQRKPKTFPRKIDFTHPGHRWLLGEGWHASEANHCWMDGDASFQIAGPETSAQKLRIRGSSPHSDGAALTVIIDGIQTELIKLKDAGVVDVVIPLSVGLKGRPKITIRMLADHTFSPPGDPRKLAFSFISAEIS